MRTLVSTAAALSLAFAVSVAARGQSGQAAPPKEEPKADAKAPASVAGKWTVSLQTQNGTMTPALDIKLDGKKVTGTITSPQGEAPIAGEFADSKLTFNLTIQGNSGEMQLTFTGTLKSDDTIAGTMSFGQGELPWTATRVKEK